MAMRYYVPFPDSSGFPGNWGGPPPPGQHALRVGDAERDAAAADLSEHYAAGRLSADELNERLDAVFAAKTFGQLAQVLADLPGLGRPSWQGSFPLTPVPGPRPGTGWTPVLAEDPSGASDRAGRVAALSLLILAVAIWLFTALLFASQGYYHPYGYGPYGPHPPPGQYQHVQLLPEYEHMPPTGP